MEGPVLRLFERYLSLPPMSSINGEKLDKGLFRVYARVGVCKEGVASPLEDYDPLLYKANNTTMLAMQVSQFMPRVGREVANRRQAQPVGMLRQSGLNTQSSASISEGIVQQLADELLLKFMQEQKNLGMSDVDASLDVNDDDDDDDDDSSSDLNDDDISSSDLNACLQEQLDNLLDQINKIKEKSQELTDKRDLPAAIAATELFSTLSKIVLVEPPIVENNEIKGLDNFKSKCHAAIAKARPALTRGWSQILGNVALAIGLVGLLYVAAGLIHMAKTGDFLFFKTKSEKDSQQKLNQIEKTIDEGFDEGFKERIRAN